MRIIAFIALFALAANAFNLTAYHQGFDSVLGFNATQVEQGTICLNTLTADAAQIYETIKSGSFDTIALNLGEQVEQFKTDLSTTCLPYFADQFGYIYQTTGDVNLTQRIKENFEKYYAYIIQDVALIASVIEDSSDSSDADERAGVIQGYLVQMLLGISGPAVDYPEVNTTAIVPLNQSKFFTEYFNTIFQGLGINASVNVPALIQCNYNIQNATATFIYIKQNFSTLDFQEKLDAVQYLISHIFATISSCEGAWQVEEAVLMPVFEAFEQDPVTFTLGVAERIALNLPLYITSIKQEIIDIQEGKYVAAGVKKLERIEIDFTDLVNFTSSSQ